MPYLLPGKSTLTPWPLVLLPVTGPITSPCWPCTSLSPLSKVLLVVQTMPSQLLEQSKSTLRATFSSVLKKRIFTLTYDRSTAMTWHMVQKLRSARRVSGVLLCSASTIKSIQLKFLEALDTLSDQRRGALAMERQTKTLSAVLDLFSSGALVMDEVRR